MASEAAVGSYTHCSIEARLGMFKAAYHPQQLPAPTPATENNSHRPTGFGPFSAPAHTPAQLHPQLSLQTNIIVAGC